MKQGLLHIAKRAVIMQACTGRTRQEAADLLGMGVRALSEFLKAEGFKREKINGPYESDLDQLKNALNLDS